MSAYLHAILAAQDARQRLTAAERAVSEAERAYSKAERLASRRQSSPSPAVRQRAQAEATARLDELDECRANLGAARQAVTEAEQHERQLTPRSQPA